MITSTQRIEPICRTQQPVLQTRYVHDYDCAGTQASVISLGLEEGLVVALLSLSARHDETDKETAQCINAMQTKPQYRYGVSHSAQEEQASYRVASRTHQPSHHTRMLRLLFSGLQRVALGVAAVPAPSFPASFPAAAAAAAAASAAGEFTRWCPFLIIVWTHSRKRQVSW